ncbi:hypothetical protein Tco_1401951 [Tanacetum coccineum]
MDKHGGAFHEAALLHFGIESHSLTRSPEIHYGSVDAGVKNGVLILVEDKKSKSETYRVRCVDSEGASDNPTPDYVFKSPSSFPIPVVDSDSFFEKSDTSLSQLDNSLPEFKTFSNYTKETRSGSTTTHANYSLHEYDSFLFEFESFHFDLDPSFPRPPPEPPDVKIILIIETDAPVINNFDELNKDECFDPGGDEINVEDDDSFTFVIRTFLPFLTYPEVSLVLFSTRNEDTIFDPGIST